MLLLVGLAIPAANTPEIATISASWPSTRSIAASAASPWRARFNGEASEVSIGSDKAVLLKPTTFMNESGRAVGEAMRFYKIALNDVFVFHDELDLAPGKMRLKRGGGNAGHNGLRSITAHCTNEYPRIRLGIGHPGDKALVHSYVLSDFAKAGIALGRGSLCRLRGKRRDPALRR